MSSKTSVAILVGVAVAGSVLVAPTVVAAPSAGRATAWGYNYFGQLGNGSTTDSSVPVNTSGVLAGKTVTAISTGRDHTCAVADGRAYCWGNNDLGQLGINTTTSSSVPVTVDTSGVLASKTVTAISAGGSHTCAVADGRAYCWGLNDNGRLGNNSATLSMVPVAVHTAGVLGGKTVSAITAGNDGHTCAIADGQAYCWGKNLGGQLGNDSFTESSVPVTVDTSGVLASKTVTAISAGTYHTCAAADGAAYCWGWDGFGQLGNSGTHASVPVAVTTTGELGGKTVTAITGGTFHTCAIADDRAYCWGFNGLGQLGINSTSDSYVPLPVDTSGPLAGKTVTAITAGYNHTCAMAEGRAFCWGDNVYGQLGNNTVTNVPTTAPVPVNTNGPLAGKTVTAISAGGSHSAVLAAAPPQPPTAVSGMAGDAKVTVSWQAPGDDGGSPVLDYVATAIPGGASCTTSSTSCVVSGLANGTAYTFTVTARNVSGTSSPSAPAMPVIPAAAITSPSPVTPVAPVTPGKVTGLKAVVRKGKVTITWKPVSTATTYGVRISKPGGKKYKAWTTTTKRTFTAKVRKAKKYRFQVAANGTGGSGPLATIRFKGK